MRNVRRKGKSAPYGESGGWLASATLCGRRCGDCRWIIEATCRLNTVEALKHGFNQDKGAMYAIEKLRGMFVKPEGIVADPANRAL